MLLLSFRYSWFPIFLSAFLYCFSLIYSGVSCIFPFSFRSFSQVLSLFPDFPNSLLPECFIVALSIPLRRFPLPWDSQRSFLFPFSYRFLSNLSFFLLTSFTQRKPLLKFFCSSPNTFFYRFFPSLLSFYWRFFPLFHFFSSSFVSLNTSFVLVSFRLPSELSMLSALSSSGGPALSLASKRQILQRRGRGGKVFKYPCTHYANTVVLVIALIIVIRL